MSKVNNVEEISAGEIHGKVAYPGRGKTFCSSPKSPDWPWGPPNLLFNGNQGSFLEIKQSVCETDHSSPTSTEVKNEWSYTPSSFICFDGVNGDNFTFYVCLQASPDDKECISVQIYYCVCVTSQSSINLCRVAV
jgi:hypothetical protein